jgi:hypothetical protein
MELSVIFSVCAVVFLGGVAYRWKERKTTHGKWLIAMAVGMFFFCVIAALNFALNPQP